MVQWKQQTGVTRQKLNCMAMYRPNTPSTNSKRKHNPPRGIPQSKPSTLHKIMLFANMSVPGRTLLRIYHCLHRPHSNTRQINATQLFVCLVATTCANLICFRNEGFLRRILLFDMLKTSVKVEGFRQQTQQDQSLYFQVTVWTW